MRPGGRLRDAERGLQQALEAGPPGSEREQAARAELTAAEGNARAHSFFDLTWVLLTAAALVVVVTTARLAGRRRVWDAALVAVAPGLVLHLTTNWDLIATAFAGAGLLAWARRRPVLAGVLLGLGTATKLYPAVFLLPLLVLCWRAGRVREGVRTALALVLTAAAVTVPVYLSSPAYAELDGVQTAVAASPLDRFGSEGLAALRPHVVGTAPDDRRARRGRQRGLPVRRAQRRAPRRLGLAALRAVAHPRLRRRPARAGVRRARHPRARPAGRARGRPAQPVGGARHAARPRRGDGARAARPRRPRLPQLLFLTVVGFLLFNKVWSPQYVLWLLPLAALARPRWRPFLAWQAAEAAVLITRFLFFVSMPYGEGDQTSEGIDVTWFLSAVVLRDVALLLLAAAVVRDVLRPEHDVVRADGEDDPAGGVLDGAPDVRGPAEREPALA